MGAVLSVLPNRAENHTIEGKRNMMQAASNRPLCHAGASASASGTMATATISRAGRRKPISSGRAAAVQDGIRLWRRAISIPIQ